MPKRKIPPRARPEWNRQEHAAKVGAEFDRVRQEAQDRGQALRAHALPVKNGMHVEFQSVSGFDLDVDKLDRRSAGIRLLTVRRDAEDPDVQRAVVYVPSSAIETFPGLLRQYAEEDTDRGRPKNQPLIESIAHVQLAVLRSFWTDSPDLFPTDPNAVVWWEVWLRDNDDALLHELRTAAERLELVMSPREIRFVERCVVLVQANAASLVLLIEASEVVAELRAPMPTADEFLDLSGPEQQEYVEDVLRRARLPDQTSPVICVLDTGVNRGHPLLEPILSAAAVYAVDEVWGTADDHPQGHGTQMAGLAAYGDLTEHLAGNAPIEVPATLESVKVFSTANPQREDLWGAITSEAVYLVESKAPGSGRLFSMAVADLRAADRGRPSSWSATIDRLAHGEEGEPARLFIICAGNGDRVAWSEHPNHLPTTQVKNPGQSWNALTVGAMTYKNRVTEPAFTGWRSIAAAGDLSPCTSTSVLWEAHWPTKPDIVMEGGNAALPPNGDTIDTPESLAMLTTHHRFQTRPFAGTGETSAATAIAARMAAAIQDRYPDFWAQTVRAALVHSARWTPEMMSHYPNPTDRVHSCGFGEPDLGRALWSLQHQPTLVIQDSLQPFMRESGGQPKMNEMHLHPLPWPREQLLDLGDAEVELSVTLSYFIEPNPGQRGWTTKHRYPSSMLRFYMQSPGESVKDFRAALNQLARSESRGPGPRDYTGWQLSDQLRHRGSIHSDRWIGTAAALADRENIAVVPRGGWWKERPHLECWQRAVDYALLVTIAAPEIGVDLYTPISAMIPVPVEIPTE